MRLSPRIINIIKKNVLNSFGNVNIYLFGSRTDDIKKGGDIDIALDTNLSTSDFKKKKILFISSLIRLGYDLKIDIVNYNTNDKLLYQEIQANHLKL